MFGSSRKALLIPLLLLAVGVPYLISSQGQSFSGWFGSLLGSGAPAGAPDGAAAAANSTPPWAGPGKAEFADVFRFDISPSWISSRWPRVTTSLSDPRYEGMRVPLVTGTQDTDVAGSLTYYFDAGQRLQRISFRGFTGDPQPFVRFVTQHFGLNAEPTRDAGLYVKRWNVQPLSVLRVDRAPVIASQQANQRFAVEMELNRPDNYASMSPEWQPLFAPAPQPSAKPAQPGPGMSWPFASPSATPPALVQ